MHRIILVAACAALVTVFSGAARPSFVIMLADDLGYGDLGCYGHPHIRTPHIDSLAKQGVRLTDYYAAAPVCSPSRAAMLAGRWPSRMGIDDWIPAGSPVHLAAGEVAIATLLSRAGYATCHVGKWHCNGVFNSPEQPQPGDHGFAHWFSTQNNAQPTHANPRNFVRNGKRVGPLAGYSSDIIVDEALAWLKTVDRETPLCLFMWFHSPHEKIATAERFSAPYRPAVSLEQAEYFGNVTQMDAAIGRLLQALDDAGRSDDTLVAFTSDNGPEPNKRYVGAERSHGSTGKLRGKKLQLYEGGIRVPFVARWPGKAPAGREVHSLVGGVDILPTLAAAAGVPLPVERTIDGIDASPALAGQEFARDKPLFWRYDVAQGDWKRALRDGDWKLLADEKLTRFELYNLASDPEEKNDLSASSPEQFKKMRDKLAAIDGEVTAERAKQPK